MTLRLPQRCLDRMKAAGAAAYPHEACGLLVGEGEEVLEVVPADNVADQPGKAFEIDPEVLLHWQKKLRGSAQRILGHYHSHPDHPADPSKRDRARIYEDGLVWAILSVTEDGAGEINFYRAGQGDFTPLEVSVF
ncbi:M67 family metallopeptidase [Emcibacter sp.]|uniref:M67 family metallopeptidase n=1 Tax=Emcibacter sp. TaxID=1979954 RepID=UPI002AA73F33|nr:M67 family metallopeptidase [Emcibacter sp.]